jgi:hypothetical protein
MNCGYTAACTGRVIRMMRETSSGEVTPALKLSEASHLQLEQGALAVLESAISGGKLRPYKDLPHVPGENFGKGNNT